jgi:hypothetical protein
MDVIVFLCVSLGSSTATFMTVYVVEAHTHVQRLVSVVKMATVFEGCTIEEQRSVVRFFCGQKDSMQKMFINKCVLFTVGSKAVQPSCKPFADDERMKRRCRSGWDNSQNWLLCCGLRPTGKAMGQIYQCWWRICREINVFILVSNITCFTFYIHMWPIYWLSTIPVSFKWNK